MQQQDRVYTVEAARMLGRSPKTLEKWRVKGTGPAHYSDGYRTFYLRQELEAHLASQITHP